MQCGTTNKTRPHGLTPPPPTHLHTPSKTKSAVMKRLRAFRDALMDGRRWRLGVLAWVLVCLLATVARSALGKGDLRNYHRAKVVHYGEDERDGERRLRIKVPSLGKIFELVLEETDVFADDVATRVDSRLEVLDSSRFESFQARTPTGASVSSVFRDAGTGTFHALIRDGDSVFVLDHVSVHGLEDRGRGLGRGEDDYLDHDHIVFDLFTDLDNNDEKLDGLRRLFGTTGRRGSNGEDDDRAAEERKLGNSFRLSGWNVQASSLSRLSGCPGRSGEPPRLVFKVGLAVDAGFTRAFGGASGAQAEVARIMNDIQVLYSANLGVLLQVSHLEVKTTPSSVSSGWSGSASADEWNSAPSVSGMHNSCPSIAATSQQESIMRQLFMFADWRGRSAPDVHQARDQKAGIWHLLTDCHPAPGTIGSESIGSELVKTESFCIHHSPFTSHPSPFTHLPSPTMQSPTWEASARARRSTPSTLAAHSSAPAAARARGTRTRGMAIRHASQASASRVGLRRRGSLSPTSSATTLAHSTTQGALGSPYTGMESCLMAP